MTRFLGLFLAVIVKTTNEGFSTLFRVNNFQPDFEISHSLQLRRSLNNGYHVIDDSVILHSNP